MAPKFNEMTLANLGEGAAVERFQEELTKVIENILDPNTEAETKRAVVMKVTIKPDKGRVHGRVEVTCEARLAAARLRDAGLHGRGQSHWQDRGVRGQPEPAHDRVIRRGAEEKQRKRRADARAHGRGGMTC